MLAGDEARRLGAALAAVAELEGRGELHGPYWYSYWKKDGKTKSKYVGKSRPSEG